MSSPLKRQQMREPSQEAAVAASGQVMDLTASDNEVR